MNLYTITGMSSSGKTSLVNTLINKYPDKFQRIKTATTRRRRKNEGKDAYCFMSEQEYDSASFMALKMAFAGHRYGVPMNYASEENKDQLVVLDRSGALISKFMAWPGLPKVFNVYIESDRDRMRTFKKRNWRRYKEDIKAELNVREGYDCVIRNDGTLDDLADEFMNFVVATERRQELGMEN